VVNFINLEQTFTPSEGDLRRFWDLESIGISANHDRSLSAKDSKLLEDFQASFRMEDHRRVVSLPRKQNIAIPSNKLNAEKRLNNVTDLKAMRHETDVLRTNVKLRHEGASGGRSC
jgi:hypothetical protein